MIATNIPLISAVLAMATAPQKMAIAVATCVEHATAHVLPIITKTAVEEPAITNVNVAHHILVVPQDLAQLALLIRFAAVERACAIRSIIHAPDAPKRTLVVVVAPLKIMAAGAIKMALTAALFADVLLGVILVVIRVIQYVVPEHPAHVERDVLFQELKFFLPTVKL